MTKTIYVLNAFDFDQIEETQTYLEENVPIDTNLIAIFHPSTDESQIRVACKLGFKDPIVTNNDEVLLYTTFTHNFNHELHIPEEDIDKIIHLIELTIQNYNSEGGGGCSMNLILEPNSMKVLKGYAQRYKFQVGSKKSKVQMEQREISGIFSCEPIGYSNSVTTLLISVNPSTVSKGEKEEADYMLANGSFHTHPIEAYKSNNVGCAWPSKDDYRTVLHIFSEGYGLFHIVSTIEGIYIISFNDQVNRKEIKKNVDKYLNEIQKNFVFTYPPWNISDSEKEHHIRSNLKYVNEEANPHIFHVQFFWWDRLPEMIQVDLKGMNEQCLFVDTQVKFSQLLDEVRSNCPKNKEMCSKLGMCKQ